MRANNGEVMPTITHQICLGSVVTHCRGVMVQLFRVVQVMRLHVSLHDSHPLEEVC